ncbi:hypothetical protein HDU97_003277 [Phlyctochytrium planicorne]|nr:hypothetical protein HDU97_003277 [Phlyctochytrium planicorne]
MVDYEHFLNQLRQEEAANLTLQLKNFLRAFHAQQRPIPEKRRAIARFLEHIYGESLQNPVFSSATEDDELENIREGWEKLLLIKVYDDVFGAPGTDENKMTQYLTRKIEQFSWMQERHLDLPFQIGASLEVAQAELLRVNGFRCPKDKLAILMNVMQTIADLIQKQKGHAGNDHLLPVLILAIIRSNPPALISNVKYVMRFRYPSELEKGPVQFCLTSMMGAISFIYNMKISSLTLTPEELQQYGGKMPAPNPRTQSRNQLPGNAPPPLPPRSPAVGSTASLSTSPPTSSKVNELATNIYSSTIKMFDTTATAIKSAAETAAVTVDGFAQGLIERFKEDNPNGTKSANASTGSLIQIDEGGPSESNGPPPNNRNWMTRLSSREALNATMKPLPPNPGTIVLPPNPTTNLPGQQEVRVDGELSSSEIYERFASAKDRETFEAALSDAERGVLEDYELQLALALSMSIEDSKVAGIDYVPSPTRGSPTKEANLIDVGDEKPKEPPTLLDGGLEAYNIPTIVQAGGAFDDEADDFEVPLKSPLKKKSAEVLKESVAEVAEAGDVRKGVSVPGPPGDVNGNDESLI